VPTSVTVGSPESVSRAAHSHPRHDPDHSYYASNIGAGIVGGKLPPFLAAETGDGASTPAAWAENVAYIRMRVPSGAEVWVDGVKTRLTGSCASSTRRR
jgi:hypothetical protein